MLTLLANAHKSLVGAVLGRNVARGVQAGKAAQKLQMWVGHAGDSTSVKPRLVALLCRVALRVFRVLRRHTFPPELSWRGAHPSQAQHACAWGHFRRARPIAERMVCTGLACRPGMATSSTPVS
jgi:hypothetical protein